MIKFDDGTVISWNKAAQMIEAEGRLITGELLNPDGRCAMGVIGDFKTPLYSENRKTRVTMRRFDSPLATTIRPMVEANNTFMGTPEQRAVYMAAWCRAQEQV